MLFEKGMPGHSGESNYKSLLQPIWGKERCINLREFQRGKKSARLVID